MPQDLPSLRLLTSLPLLFALSACSSSDDAGTTNQNAANPVPAAGSAGTAGEVAASGGGAGGATMTAQVAGNSAGGASAGADSGGASAGGASGSAGAAGNSGAGGSSEPPEETDERPWFSFFVTSMDSLLEQAHGDDVPADLTDAGFGGDLGGLEGADAICTALAQLGNPGDTKTWRAFLSTAPGGPGEVVNAIDRIGEGPWYDWNNRIFAENKAALTSGDNGRPAGIDPQLGEMFSDEYGNPIRIAEEDNHDMLTGSDTDGMLQGGLDETCQNWTFNGEYDNDVDVRVGHAWPRTANNGREWISDHTVNGCMPGVHIAGGGGAPNGNQRVGAGGGFGGFYCFALSSE